MPPVGFFHETSPGVLTCEPTLRARSGASLIQAIDGVLSEGRTVNTLDLTKLGADDVEPKGVQALHDGPRDAEDDLSTLPPGHAALERRRALGEREHGIDRRTKTAGLDQGGQLDELLTVRFHDKERGLDRPRFFRWFLGPGPQPPPWSDHAHGASEGLPA